MSRETRLTTLENGLKIVSQFVPGLETATVGVWVDAGSRHETARQNGISHMLEHMAFKGTATRSAERIAQEIEDVGGYLNAYTSREHTAYYARVLKDDVPLAIDLIADILQRSTFVADEIERERGVIVQEIGQAVDTPDELVFDYLQECAYPAQPIGRNILGTVDNVRRFAQGDLTDYMAAHYHAPSMVLTAAGAVEHEALVALAQAHFTSLNAARPRDVHAARYAGGETRLQEDYEQAHITLALPGVTYEDPDYMVAKVFVNALGGGMSSRLFQEVREKRGLCYSIYAYSNSYADTGIVGFYAGTGEDDADQILPVSIAQIEAMARGCSEEETARARAQLRAGILMGLESCASVAESMAIQTLLFGQPVPVAERLARIDAIDAAAVRRFAERVLRAGHPTLAALGPITKLPPLEALAGTFG